MANELLKLSLDDLPRKRAMFGAMAARAKDLTPVWPVAHAMFVIEEQQQFASEGAYLLGSEWTPLSPAYAAVKPTPPAPYGILYLTGRLLRSLTTEGDPEHVDIRQPDQAVFGSTVPYGHWHQTGATLPHGGILPQRQVIKARDAYRRLLLRATWVYISTGRAPTVPGEGS